MTDFEYQFKLVLIGHDKAGKSSIISRFVSNTYASSYVATIGADFKVRNLNVVDKVCQLQIWDTAGLSCFQSAPETVYRNAQGVFICYDVTSRASFDSLPKWLHQAQSHAPLDAVIYIIGCKCEASAYNRRVSREEGEQLAGAKGCRFGECSAKNNVNIEQIYLEMCILLRDQADQEAENALLVRRNTLTEGNKVLQSAYAVHVSGATSWYNASKINGRYVPQMSKTSSATQAEEFSYTNVDSPSSVMVYRDNTWIIRVHRKPLARVSSASILQFPDVASVKNVWFENTGVYFTWWHARPAIKCVLLHGGHQGSFSGNSGNSSKNNLYSGGTAGNNGNNNISIKRSASNNSILGACSSHGSSGGGGSAGSGGKGASSQRASVAAGVLATGSPPLDIFAGARGAQGGINMELFTQCCKEPSKLGLSAPLFVQYCVIRLAMLEYERKYKPSSSSGYDSRAMLHICAQLQRVQDTVREMAAALKIDLTLSNSAAGAPQTAAAVLVAGAANAGASASVNLSANASATTSVGPAAGSESSKASGLADPTTPRSPVSPSAPASNTSTSQSTAPASAPAPAPVPQVPIPVLPVPPPLPYGPLLEVSADAITAATKDFLRPLSRHLALLCDVGESGNFEQARRCRDVRVEVEQYVLDLQQPQQRTSFSFSGRNSFSARNSFSGGSNRGSFSRSSFSGRNSFSGTPGPPPTNVVAK